MKVVRATAVLALAVILAGCSDGGPPSLPAVAAPSAASAAPSASTTTHIDWSDARANLSTKATVCGPVISTFTASSSLGKPTFVNIGLDYPDPAGFTVVIFDDYRAAFPFDPAAEYQGANLCVTGEIRGHEEFVQIEARSPDQIVVQG